MAVYSSVKEYHTRAHMGMIDVTGDFQQAVSEAGAKAGIKNGKLRPDENGEFHAPDHGHTHKA